MSTATIIAFLYFLSAFNVPTPTIQNISNILYATQSSTSQVTAVTTLQATPTGDTTLTVQNSPQILSFGSTITPMTPVENKSALVVEKEGTNSYLVRVLDTKGVPVSMAPVHFDAPDIATQEGASKKTDKFTNARTTPDLNDWYTEYDYYPVTKGAQTLTFTSGGLSKSVTIEVQ